jgi:hypothetical protein
VAPGFALAAVCTVPWVVFLGVTLPATARVNDRIAWVGFDAAELAMLAITAFLAWRGKPKVAMAATALATMLVVDAWFDVNTSEAGIEREMAVGFAVLEVSLAAVSLWIAFHAASVVRRRMEGLAAHEAEPDARRQVGSREHPRWLPDVPDWTKDLPGLWSEAAAPSHEDPEQTTPSADRARDRACHASDRASRARDGAVYARGDLSEPPRTKDASTEPQSGARLRVRRYVSDDRSSVAPELAE